MTAEPRDIRERVALAMGWRQAGNGKEWINPRTGLRVTRPPRITEHAAFEMLREMGRDDNVLYIRLGETDEGARCQVQMIEPPLNHVAFTDTLEHAIAECWLAWRAAREVRE